MSFKTKGMLNTLLRIRAVPGTHNKSFKSAIDTVEKCVVCI